MFRFASRAALTMVAWTLAVYPSGIVPSIASNGQEPMSVW